MHTKTLCSEFLFVPYVLIYPQNCHGAVHKKVAKIKNQKKKLKINNLCASKLKIILILVTVFNEFTFVVYCVIFSLSFGVMFYLLVNISIGGCKQEEKFSS